jgi:tRNA(fMet)-specific endonuclease VapC
MSTESLALDTSVVVRHLRAGSAAVAEPMEAAAALFLPLTALGELRYGVRYSGQARAAAQLERFLEDVVILLPDERTAESYAELKRVVSLAGKPIPENDLWIAATACSYGLTLFCQDAHFDLLAGSMSILQAAALP